MSRQHQPISASGGSRGTMRNSQVTAPTDASNTYSNRQPSSAGSGTLQTASTHSPEEDSDSTGPVENHQSQLVDTEWNKQWAALRERRIEEEDESLELRELLDSLHVSSFRSAPSLAQDSLVGRDDDQISVAQFRPLNEHSDPSSSSQHFSTHPQRRATSNNPNFTPPPAAQVVPIPAPRVKFPSRTEDGDYGTLTNLPVVPQNADATVATSAHSPTYPRLLHPHQQMSQFQQQPQYLAHPQEQQYQLPQTMHHNNTPQQYNQRYLNQPQNMPQMYQANMNQGHQIQYAQAPHGQHQLNSPMYWQQGHPANMYSPPAAQPHNPGLIGPHNPGVMDPNNPGGLGAQLPVHNQQHMYNYQQGQHLQYQPSHTLHSNQVQGDAYAQSNYSLGIHPPAMHPQNVPVRSNSAGSSTAQLLHQMAQDQAPSQAQSQNTLYSAPAHQPIQSPGNAYPRNQVASQNGNLQPVMSAAPPPQPVVERREEREPPKSRVDVKRPTVNVKTTESIRAPEMKQNVQTQPAAKPPPPAAQTSQNAAAAPAASPTAAPAASASAVGNSGFMEEQDALKEFRLRFRMAEIKEKGGKLDDALEEYNMALYFEMQARGENNAEIAKTNRVIARLCLRAKKYKEAAEHLEQAIAIYQRCGCSSADTDALWSTHDQLAQTYMHLANPDKEIEHYQKAINILTGSTSIPPERLAHMHNNVGVSLHKRNKHEEALTHLEKSKEMMTLLHLGAESDDMAKVHKSLGDLYQDLGHTDKAIAEYNFSLRIYAKSAATGLGKLLSAPVHKALSKIYQLKGDVAKAREHAQAEGESSEGLGNAENRQLLSEMADRAGMGNVLDVARAAQDQVDKAQQYQQENNNMMAIQHYHQAIQSVNNLPSDQRYSEEVVSKLAMIHNNLGNAYRSVSRLDMAKEHMMKALELRRNLYADQACDDTVTSLFNLGYIYSQIGDIPSLVESFNYHKEALAMYLKLGNLKGNLKWVVGLYRSLASTSYNLGETQQSVEYYEKAKVVIQEHGTDGEMGKQLQAVYNNIGNSYKALKDFKRAEENLTEALEMATILRLGNPDNLEYQNDIASAHNNLGCMYQEMENYPKALEHHQDSLQIRRLIAPQYAEAATDLPSSLHNIGNTYLAASELNEALTYYTEEYEVRRNLGDDTSDVLISMSKIYERKGDMERAQECITKARR